MAAIEGVLLVLGKVRMLALTSIGMKELIKRHRKRWKDLKDF